MQTVTIREQSYGHPPLVADVDPWQVSAICEREDGEGCDILMHSGAIIKTQTDIQVLRDELYPLGGGVDNQPEQE